MTFAGLGLKGLGCLLKWWKSCSWSIINEGSTVQRYAVFVWKRSMIVFFWGTHSYHCNHPKGTRTLFVGGDCSLKISRVAWKWQKLSVCNLCQPVHSCFPLKFIIICQDSGLCSRFVENCRDIQQLTNQTPSHGCCFFVPRSCFASLGKARWLSHGFIRWIHNATKHTQFSTILMNHPKYFIREELYIYIWFYDELYLALPAARPLAIAKWHASRGSFGLGYWAACI